MGRKASSRGERVYDRLIRLWDRYGPLTALQEAGRLLTADRAERVGARVVRGMALRALLRYEEGARDLRAALREAPTSWERFICTQLGELYEAKGSQAAAERWFRKAAEGRPGETSYLLPLADLLARQGRLGEATRAFRRATVVERGDHAAAHFGLARVYVARGRPREALFHLERTLEHDPRHREAKRTRRDVQRSIELRARR